MKQKKAVGFKRTHGLIPIAFENEFGDQKSREREKSPTALRFKTLEALNCKWAYFSDGQSYYHWALHRMQLKSTWLEKDA